MTRLVFQKADSVVYEEDEKKAFGVIQATNYENETEILK